MCCEKPVLVRYEIPCDMVRNDGPTWNVVSFGIISKMAFHVEWCNVKWGSYDVMRSNGSVIHSTTTAQYQSHIKPHFLLSTPYHILPHSTSHHVFQYQITQHMAWCGIVWCGSCGFAMPDVRYCALFIPMWLRCGITRRCDVEYGR